MLYIEVHVGRQGRPYSILGPTFCLASQSGSRGFSHRTLRSKPAQEELKVNKDCLLVSAKVELIGLDRVSSIWILSQIIHFCSNISFGVNCIELQYIAIYCYFVCRGVLKWLKLDNLVLKQNVPVCLVYNHAPTIVEWKILYLDSAMSFPSVASLLIIQASCLLWITLTHILTFA